MVNFFFLRGEKTKNEEEMRNKNTFYWCKKRYRLFFPPSSFILLQIESKFASRKVNILRSLSCVCDLNSFGTLSRWSFGRFWSVQIACSRLSVMHFLRFHSDSFFRALVRSYNISYTEKKKLRMPMRCRILTKPVTRSAN